MIGKELNYRERELGQLMIVVRVGVRIRGYGKCYG